MIDGVRLKLCDTLGEAYGFNVSRSGFFRLFCQLSPFDHNHLLEVPIPEVCRTPPGEVNISIIFIVYFHLKNIANSSSILHNHCYFKRLQTYIHTYILCFYGLMPTTPGRFSIGMISLCNDFQSHNSPRKCDSGLP